MSKTAILESPQAKICACGKHGSLPGEDVCAECYVAQADARRAANPKTAGTPLSERSLIRKITDSSLYDGHPLARFLLTQLVALAMSEDSNYPADAPDEYHADKEGWCWMAQDGLSLKVGCEPTGRTVRNWITRFRADGVILYRDWYDENQTHHAEYKVVESVVDAFQRPAKKADAIAARKDMKRYSEPRTPNKGSFSTSNQPDRKTKIRGDMEDFLE